MTVRGLIIAAETYPSLEESLAPVLPGTQITAERFREWLIDDKGVAEADIAFCTDDPDAPGRTAGASRKAIVNEVLRLQRAGQDATGELYVFLSGHGFGYADIDGVRVADLFICTDYQNRTISGDAVLRIDALQTWLRLCLGPGDHYYFVDCCRNSLSTREIRAIELLLPFDNSRLGQPAIYTMFSTQEWTGAAVWSGFGEALLDGLKGAGRAKEWRGQDMAVVFQSLKAFVRARMPSQPIESRVEGDGDGVIVTITPPPRYTCTVKVADADPADQFEIAVKTIRGQPIGVARPFVGAQGGFDDVPDDYHVEVRHGGNQLIPAVQPADLYDHCEVLFRKKVPPGFGDDPRRRESRVAGLSITAPILGGVTVRRVDRKRDQSTIDPGKSRSFEGAGKYEIEVHDTDRVVFRREVLDVSSGTHLLDFSQSGTGRFGDMFVKGRRPTALAADQGLDLQLALLGAARIAGVDGPATPVALDALQSFAEQAPGASPVYVLAGLDAPTGGVSIGVSSGAEARWVRADSVEQVPDLLQAFVPSEVAGDLVSIRIGSGPVRTVASCRMPNRVTFVTVTHGDDGELRVQQFLLPIRHLIPELPAPVRQRLLDDPLSMTRHLVRATRQMAAGRSLAAVMSEPELERLLYGKWLDPIMAVFATYELIRRGEGADGGMLAVVLQNLRRHFPELPDVPALERLAGIRRGPVRRAPLVLDGLLSLGPRQRSRVLPSDRLDYRGPWTSWINAVEPEEEA